MSSFENISKWTLTILNLYGGFITNIERHAMRRESRYIYSKIYIKAGKVIRYRYRGISLTSKGCLISITNWTSIREQSSTCLCHLIGYCYSTDRYRLSKAHCGSSDRAINFLFHSTTASMEKIISISFVNVNSR